MGLPNSLVPFLFNIVAEGLTGLTREAQKKNLFEGFLVGRNNVDISILQYADDSVFRESNNVKRESHQGYAKEF